jgi:hypothetical protein
VGGTDRPHLRGVPAVMSDLWWPDTHHRVHHLQRRHPAHSGAHRRDRLHPPLWRQPEVNFHLTTGIDSEAVARAQAQASLSCSLLRAFLDRGLFEGFEAREMLGYKHAGLDR